MQNKCVWDLRRAVRAKTLPQSPKGLGLSPGHPSCGSHPPSLPGPLHPSSPWAPTSVLKAMTQMCVEEEHVYSSHSED